jgi:signal transduction histidine kinase
MICSKSFSQQLNRQMDSLIALLNTAAEDTNKVNILNALSITDPQFGLKKYSDQALALAEKLNFKKGMAFAHYSLGLYYAGEPNNTEALKNWEASVRISEETGDKKGAARGYVIIGFHYGTRLRNYSEGVKYIRIALKIYEETGDKNGMADCYAKIGRFYHDQGNYAEDLKNCFANLKLLEETGNKGDISGAYTNLGGIYYFQGKFSEAMKYFKAALKLRQETGYKPGIAGSYNDIAFIYRKQGNYTEALKNGLLALKINQEIDDKNSSALTYENVGDTYYHLCNYTEALKNFTASLKLYEKTGDKFGLAISNIGIGKTYVESHRYEQARQYLVNGLTFAKEIRAREIIKYGYECLARMDSVVGDYEQSLVHYKLYTEYKDSLFIEAGSAEFDQTKEQYESEKKDKEIELLNKEKAIQQLQLDKQRQAKNYLIAGLALLFVLGFFIYRNHHNRQDVRLLTLRNKIASDLHDDVGSTLSSISIFSEMAQQQSKETIPMLETIGESSRKMLDAMADIVWTIKPENDQFEKIIMRMRNFAYELLGAKKIDFEFVADDDVAKINLAMEVRKNLYLIFKEATNNMVKYAEANKARFAINAEKNNLTMMIRDNGKGFDVNTVSEGNGLKNMKKRAQEIGASLVIDSFPGIGTTIQLSVAV